MNTGSRKSASTVLVGLASLCCCFANTAHAVLIPASGAGSGVGRVEHAFGPVGGLITNGGAAAVFDGYYAPNLPFGDPAGLGTTGNMMAPGFNYPAFATTPWPAVFVSDTGQFPMVANTVYTLNNGPNPSGFGGASTSMVGVGGGGRSGVAANFLLTDLSSKDRAQASTNTFSTSVVYNSVGGTTARFGHFLASDIFVPLGGYAAAGVKTIFEIGDHDPVTGGFTVDSFWEPLPIIAVFDGEAGPLVDIMQAQAFVTTISGQAGAFAAVSTTPMTLTPAGKSIRMRSTVSLVADPGATIEMTDLPAELLQHLEGPLLGFGASSDAARLLAPEPAAVGLLCLAGLAIVNPRLRYRPI